MQIKKVNTIDIDGKNDVNIASNRAFPVVISMVLFSICFLYFYFRYI